MRKTTLLLILILITGCAPTESTTVEPTAELTSPALEDNSSPAQTRSANMAIAELAVRDLALRLDIELNEITVVSIESVEWPNSALGCPLPGVDYAQVITPGYQITLEAAGEVYTYHTNVRQALVLCLDGEPQLPSIPVNPGEIQDGDPWMPVDPVPTVAEGNTIADPDPIR
jgi:hypothetical protein